MYDFEFPSHAMTTFTMVRQAWISMSKVCEEKLAKLGLTPEKAAVLWLCRDYPSVLIPAEISRMLFRENQTIAGLLNRMESEGLVRRVPKRKGHPFTEIKITPKGEEACGPAVALLKELISEFTSDLTPEEHEQVQGAMRRIRDKALTKLYIEPSKPVGFSIDQAKLPIKF